MISILLFVVGVVLLFIKQINLSSGSMLKKPGTTILGVITIISGLLAMVVGNLFGEKGAMGLMGIVAYTVPALIPIVSIQFLKKPKLNDFAAQQGTKNKAVNIIGKGILIILLVFVIWLAIRMLG